MAEPSRSEIKQAFDERIAMQERDDWSAFVETFTIDAVYVEHHMGTFHGRDAIRQWLLPVMAQCRGWTYPVDWVAIDGHRLIYHWQNRLPGARPDGRPYGFPGVTIMEYAAERQWSFQEDVYNWESALVVLKEWSAARKA